MAWADAAKLACPVGLEHRSSTGLVPEPSYEEYCVDPRQRDSEGEPTRQGPYASWYDREKTMKRSAGSYDGGWPDGVCREWYRSQNLESEVAYRGHSQHGRATYWYPSGNKRYETNNVHGRETGAFTEWYDNKKKKAWGTHAVTDPGAGAETALKPVLVGKYREWDEAGRLTVDTNFNSRGREDGRRVEYRYDLQGDKPEVLEVAYSDGEAVGVMPRKEPAGQAQAVESERARPLPKKQNASSAVPPPSGRAAAVTKE